MSLEDIKSKNLLRWEVKPIWKVSYPSVKIGSPTGNFTIFGVDRSSLDVSRNWEKINSVERFNQGFVAKPTDFTITIAVKERSEEFEKLRRLAFGAIYFDIQCDVLKRINADGAEVTHGDNQHGFGDEVASSYVQWLDGFEKYIGCLVQREGQTIEIGAIPVREFEIVFLEREIKNSISGIFNDDLISDGDGSFTDLDDLGI
jgi:hypothetical protein